MEKKSKRKNRKGGQFDIFNYAINILEDSHQLAIFESTNMNNLRLSHQATDGKEVNMYSIYMKKHELPWGKNKI